MNYADYHAQFEKILNAAHPEPPYDDAMYLDYTKLNQSRMKRWDKQMILSPSLIKALQSITQPQHWIIISEPWCGDAAHIVPFLVRMTEQNSKISYEIQLRDQPPFLIEKYLTNGTKSIPKLIVRNTNGDDIFTWGPRPAGAQQLMNELTAAKSDFEEVKIKLQKWYNSNKGEELCRELEKLIN